MKPLVLLALFIGVPLLEIYVIIQVGQAIGAWPTVLLLVVESALGAWLVKREGLKVWRALLDAIRSAALPGRELADAALVVAGGVLLLTPGFVTDVFGFCCVLPVTRPLARRVLLAVVGQQVARRTGSRYAPSAGGVHRIHTDGE